jgi:uncharacterized protein (TIGR02246 family)
MKYLTILLLFQILTLPLLFGQDTGVDEKVRQEIYSLIDNYAEARDNKDSVLLRSILTPDVDQLVSSGEWRKGIQEAIEGMMRSSAVNPGDRKLAVENIRLLDPGTGIVDARYEIEGSNGPSRKMWSTFMVVFRENKWKITGIRNMLPTGQE